MLRGEAGIFNDWWRTRLERSEWQVTETQVLYEDYVKYFMVHRPPAYPNLQAMEIYERGTYLSAIFGKGFRKRIGGKVRWVRAMVLSKP